MGWTVVFFAALLCVCGAASAQTEAGAPAAATVAPAGPDAAAAPTQGTIGIELNKLETAQDACLGYFIVDNRTADALKELQIDVFFFDKQEVILNRVALTFLDVRSGRTKVVLFELDFACGDIGRLLLNEVIACTKADASPLEGCADRLAVSSRADATFAY